MTFTAYEPETSSAELARDYHTAHALRDLGGLGAALDPNAPLSYMSDYSFTCWHREACTYSDVAVFAQLRRMFG